MLTSLVIFTQKGVLLTCLAKEAFIYFLFSVGGRVVELVVRGRAREDLGMGQVRAEQL